MPILPIKESRHYKMYRRWKKEVELDLDYVASHPGMELGRQSVMLQLAAIKDQQASEFFKTIEKYGPNAVVVE